MDQLQMLVNDLCDALRAPNATEQSVRIPAQAIIFWELDHEVDGVLLNQPQLQGQWSILKRIIQGFKPKT